MKGLTYEQKRQSELSFFANNGTVTKIEAEGVADAVAVGYLIEYREKFSYKVFAGKQGKPFKYYSARNKEEAVKRITEALLGAQASHERAEAYKQQQKENRKKPYHESTNSKGVVTRSYDTAQTAELIRQALKKEFPTTKFSVRSSTFAGGSSVDVSYTDGPRDKQVEEVTNRFKSGHFNSMEDIYEYDSDKPLVDETGQLYYASYGAKYISVHRSYSEAYGFHCNSLDLRQRPTVAEQAQAFWEIKSRQYHYADVHCTTHIETGNILIESDYDITSVERFAANLTVQGVATELDYEGKKIYLSIYVAAHAAAVAAA